jgi:hypothetical protein
MGATRRCSRCREEKPLADFAAQDVYCRPCRSDYGREHYEKNRQRYIDNAARRRDRVVRKRVSWLIDYLQENPCVDCGEGDVVVLEFDHLRDKTFDISRGLRDRNWESVLAELEKCEVVCANCHRRRTAQRAGYLRAAVAQWQSLALPRR